MVRKPSRPVVNSHSGIALRSLPRKRPVLAVVEDCQEARPPRPKKPSFRQGYKADNKQGKKSYPILPPFPCGIKKALALLNQWVKGKAITLPHVDQLPSEEDWQGLNFCPYHRKRGHNLEQCVVFHKIFDQKLEAGQILFQNEESQNVHDRPFPDHRERKGKTQVMMVSCIDKEMVSQPEDEPDLDQRASKVQDLFKFEKASMIRWISTRSRG